MGKRGEGVRRHTLSFPRKEVPRRGGGWLTQRDEKACETVLSRIGIPRRRVHGVSRDPSSSPLLADRERKRFLAFARNDDAGGGTLPPSRRRGLADILDFDFTLPPSSGRRCPEGAEAGSLSGMKKMGRPFPYRHPERSRGIFFVFFFLCRHV